MYLWLKALHLTAVIAWMAGMIAAPALLGGGMDARALASLRAIFSRIVTPAMVAALGLGLWLAQSGGWWSAGWMHAKLALVFALAALHGVVSGQMRRAAAVPDYAAPRWFGILPVVVIAAVGAIAILVIVKPG